MQSALIPRHESLLRLSKYLVEHRPSVPVAFPGTPDASDLDVLYKPASGAVADLTAEDIVDLKDLHAELDAICKRAHERGVRIIIDAEHTCVSQTCSMTCTIADNIWDSLSWYQVCFSQPLLNNALINCCDSPL